uniref:Uncharacterized protein n=1 Tax=Oryza sativa subsp. japonica TaxID=39947 RepID=Q6ZJ83_ORYSJ|nr:hypothetical protein [Oryza sativa Japonica Group]
MRREATVLVGDGGTGGWDARRSYAGHDSSNAMPTAPAGSKAGDEDPPVVAAAAVAAGGSGGGGSLLTSRLLPAPDPAAMAVSAASADPAAMDPSAVAASVAAADGSADSGDGRGCFPYPILSAIGIRGVSLNSHCED